MIERDIPIHLDKAGASDVYHRIHAELTAANAASVIRPFLTLAANHTWENNKLYKGLMAAAYATDVFDGRLAERFGKSPLGGIVDIFSDHATEALMYVHLSRKGIVPRWVPIVTIARNVTADALRVSHMIVDSSITHENNGILTLNKSDASEHVVASRLVRTGYAALKASVAIIAPSHPKAARNLSMVAAGICAVRGIPVIFNRENMQLVRLLKKKIFS